MELFDPVAHDFLYRVRCDFIIAIESHFSNNLTDVFLLVLRGLEVWGIRGTDAGSLVASVNLVNAREIEAWAVLVRLSG